MKKALITLLRDRGTSQTQFREASAKLASILAVESGAFLPKKTHLVHTPLAQTTGESLLGDALLVPILRSGLALLPAFSQFYPNASIGFIGARRDEVTAIAHLYYTNIPPINGTHTIILLDPMLATGGSAILAVDVLKAAGAMEEQILLASFIGSPQGVAHFKKTCPKAHLLIAEIDEGLNSHQWIIPGLGDFGDRYFGTLDHRET